MVRISFVFTIIIAALTNASAQEQIPEEVNKLLTKNICNTCHKLDEKLIGPSYRELSAKGNDIKTTMELIAQPKPENWPGYPPMAPMGFVDKKELKVIAKWIVELEN